MTIHHDRRVPDRRSEFNAGPLTDQILQRIAGQLEDIAHFMAELNGHMGMINGSLGQIKDILPALHGAIRTEVVPDVPAPVAAGDAPTRIP